MSRSDTVFQQRRADWAQDFPLFSLVVITDSGESVHQHGLIYLLIILNLKLMNTLRLLYEYNGGNSMFIDNIDMICELQMKITNQNALQPINYIKHSSLHLTFLSENVLF